MGQRVDGGIELSPVEGTSRTVRAAAGCNVVSFDGFAVEIGHGRAQPWEITRYSSILVDERIAVRCLVQRGDGLGTLQEGALLFEVRKGVWGNEEFNHELNLVAKTASNCLTLAVDTPCEKSCR